MKAAENFGCVGVIIYSDPADCNRLPVNYKKEEEQGYPFTPGCSNTTVQRGSVQRLSLYPGDPLTPGYPALKNATRIPVKSASSLPKIPSIPISYSDALPIFKILNGLGSCVDDWVTPNVTHFNNWKGRLHINDTDKVSGYYSGPTEGIIYNLNTQYNTTISKPITNVLATIVGINTDELVIIGNHRDSWSYGASDPASGTIALVFYSFNFLVGSCKIVTPTNKRWVETIKNNYNCQLGRRRIWVIRLD